MKKQTAVEWLKEMLIDNKYLSKDAEHLFEEAQAMEKEQIKNTFNNGYLNHKTNAEQYYNENYGKS
jgi:hypothetical protein